MDMDIKHLINEKVKIFLKNGLIFSGEFIGYWTIDSTIIIIKNEDARGSVETIIKTEDISAIEIFYQGEKNV